MWARHHSRVGNASLVCTRTRSRSVLACDIACDASRSHSFVKLRLGGTVDRISLSYSHKFDHSEELVNNKMTLTIGLLCIPVIVFTVTILTMPSLPGWTFTILPSSHFIRIILCSCRITISPTQKFLEGLSHFVIRLRQF